MSLKTSAAVWKESQHAGSALVMLLAIADYSDDKGYAYPSISTLAKKTRMKVRNAHYVMNDLQKSGELVVTIGAGRNGTNLYRITLDQLHEVHGSASLHHSAALQEAAGLHRIAEGGALECLTPLHRSAPKPSLNHQETSGTSLSRPASAKFANCPNDSIIQMYHDVLPELPRVKLMDSKSRKAKTAEFWKWVLTSTKPDGTKRASCAVEALTWIKSYFERARSNNFLMGRTPRAEAHSGWVCDLDFLLTEKGKTHVIEKTEAIS